MWYLLDSAGNKHYLRSNTQIVFGRKRGDIILENDESISRTHAYISIEPKENVEMNKPTSTCTLTDLNSKYGTYIINGEERVELSNVGYKLQDQDKIQFGLQQHIFTVVYVPLIVVTSTIQEHDRSRLEHILDEIDAFMCDNWTNSCTHLTVANAALTQKVTCAMASAVPIVTMAYWEKVYLAFANGTDLPKIEDFVPLIRESLIQKKSYSLAPNRKRSTLFQKLIFVHFSTEQYKTYGIIIRLAGGHSVSYRRNRLSMKDICAPNVIVLQYPNNTSSQISSDIADDYDAIEKALHQNKRKMIPETEIPLAIWQCSTEKHCNPTFSFAKLLKRKSASCSTAKVLAVDTQDVESQRGMLQKVDPAVPLHSKSKASSLKQKTTIIPDTCDDSNVRDISNDGIVIEPRIIKETEDTFNDTPLPQKTEPIENVKRTSAHAYIPETIDASYSHEIHEESELSAPDVEIVDTRESSRAEETGLLKVSMVVNKGTPGNNTTDTNVNEDSVIEETPANTERDANCDIWETSVSPIKVAISPVKRNAEANDDEEDTALQGTDTNQFGNDNRSRNNSECDNNEEYTVCSKKGKYSTDLNATSPKELHSTSPENSVGECQTTTDCIGEISSFLRSTVNHKTFKKVYNKIPKERITLSDMYVWQKCSTADT